MHSTKLAVCLIAVLLGAPAAARGRGPGISASIGPRSDRLPVMRKMFGAGVGVDVARMNLSFGTGRQNLRKAARIRKAAAQIGRKVLLAMDLPGPKVRLGKLPGGEIALRKRQLVTFNLRRAEASQIHLRRPSLAREVQPGDKLLLRDGRVIVEVTQVGAARGLVQGIVTKSGELASGSGVVVANKELARPDLEPADRRRIPQIARAQPDLVWLSFVTRGRQVELVRKLLSERGVKPRIWSKIETRSGLDHIDEILAASDGLVIAWGDLGRVISQGGRPRIEAMLTEKAHDAGKPIVAHTGYLSAMRTGPRPSRSNGRALRRVATLGVDYLGLDETADGDRPVDIVKAAIREISR